MPCFPLQSYQKWIKFHSSFWEKSKAHHLLSPNPCNSGTKLKKRHLGFGILWYAILIQKSKESLGFLEQRIFTERLQSDHRSVLVRLRVGGNDFKKVLMASQKIIQTSFSSPWKCLQKLENTPSYYSIFDHTLVLIIR